MALEVLKAASIRTERHEEAWKLAVQERLEVGLEARLYQDSKEKAYLALREYARAENAAKATR